MPSLHVGPSEMRAANIKFKETVHSMCGTAINYNYSALITSLTSNQNG